MKQLAAMQHSLDAEVKAKNDQQKQRKMAEGQLDDMQSSMDELEKVSCYSLGICSFFFKNGLQRP